jgi:hypoxanthine phosphoribosyltransferase
MRVAVTFAEVSRRIAQAPWPDVDAVVAIGSGGITPAAMIAHQLGVDLHLLWINYRQPHTHLRARPAPELLGRPLHLPATCRHLLLFDDVSVSGQTLQTARTFLEGRHITTAVLKGQADIVLFPELRTCALWPWSPPFPSPT